MKEIQTWHERAMAHPDHQSGMISEAMIRARMAEEIADLRAEVERLHQAHQAACEGGDLLRAEVERLARQRDEARYFLKIFVHAHAHNNAVPPHIDGQAREALGAKP